MIYDTQIIIETSVFFMFFSDAQTRACTNLYTLE